MTVYVVLGMHKSGTTLVSEAMHRSGIEMVNDVQEGMSYDAGNKYERQTFQAVNFELLACRDDRSLSIDVHAPLRESKALFSRAKDLISLQQGRTEHWGFKDPRTTLTYDFWQAILPSHTVVAVYRDPREVWCHYRTRVDDDGYLARVFSHWCAYNARLVEYVENAVGPSIVLRFERLVHENRSWRRLESFLGRKLEDVRRFDLHRSVLEVSVSTKLPSEAWDIMGRLEKLS